MQETQVRDQCPPWGWVLAKEGSDARIREHFRLHF